MRVRTRNRRQRSQARRWAKRYLLLCKHHLLHYTLKLPAPPRPQWGSKRDHREAAKTARRITGYMQTEINWLNKDE